MFHKKVLRYIMAIFIVFILSSCYSFGVDFYNQVADNKEYEEYEEYKEYEDVNEEYEEYEDGSVNENEGLSRIDFYLRNQVAYGITINTQEDAENIDLGDFFNSPYFTYEENKQIKRAVIDVALYLSGFDIGYDIWTLVDKEASRELFYERGFEPLGLLEDGPLEESGFWITTHFMMPASRGDDSLGLIVRTRWWPREQPYLDHGAWLLFDFINIDGVYKIISLSADA